MFICTFQRITCCWWGLQMTCHWPWGRCCHPTGRRKQTRAESYQTARGSPGSSAGNIAHPTSNMDLNARSVFAALQVWASDKDSILAIPAQTCGPYRPICKKTAKYGTSLFSAGGYGALANVQIYVGHTQAMQGKCQGGHNGCTPWCSLNHARQEHTQSHDPR